MAETPLHILKYRRFALRHFRDKMPQVTEAQWHAIESRIIELTAAINAREERVRKFRERA